MLYERAEMSSHVRIQHYPQVLAASSTIPITANAIGGFLCTGSGNFTFSYYNDQGTLVNFPVIAGVAGTWYPMPFYFGPNGGQVVTGVGATGILAA